MIGANPQKAVLLYLTFLGFVSGTIILLLADVPPVRATFVRPDNLFACLTQAQLLFVVFMWPLFIPSLARREPDRAADPPSMRPLLVHAAVLLILVLPLALICANVSDVGVGAFLRSEGLVAALAAFDAALFAVGLGRGWTVGPWYFLAAFVASAVFPFLQFLSRDLGRGADLSFLAAVSPFWGALDAAGTKPLVQIAVFGLAALGLSFAGRALRRPSPERNPAAETGPAKP